MALKYKQKLYIFDSREMLVLIILILTLAGFAFTLGVHYAKQLHHPEKFEAKDKIRPVEASPESVPSQVELTEQGQKIDESLNESLKKNLHDEVEKTGIKLKAGRQVNLPKTPKSQEAGATTLHEPTQVKPTENKPAQPESKEHKNSASSE
jgi:hypothetical protein